jgi:hypothetical protein
MSGMGRREFVALVGGAAAWPLTARAQQASMPVVGFLHSGSPHPYAGRMAGFRQGLGDTGFVEGKDVALEYRWALIVNLKTAKLLGLKIADSFLLLADEVIE